MSRHVHLRGCGRDAQWQALDDAVAELDFERALGLCRSLLAEAVA
jgi:hypothetical protein